MFQGTVGPSSGDTTVLMRHWYAGAYAPAYQCRINTVVSPDDGLHSRPKHVEIDKYTKNKLCTKLVLVSRLYRDARSTKH